MVNFERSSLDAFNDISSIDQYRRSLEEGFSEEGGASNHQPEKPR